MALNDAQVRAAKWDGKDYYLNDGNGLYLYVRKASKRWIIRRKRDGKMRVTSLGQYPDIGLKAARNTAAAPIPSATRPDVTVAEAGRRVPRHHRARQQAAAPDDRLSRPGSIPCPAENARRRCGPHRSGDGNQGLHDRAMPVTLATVRAMPSGASCGSCSGWRSNWVTATTTLPTRSPPASPATSRQTAPRVLTDDEIKLLWHEKHKNARLLRFLLLTGVRIGEAQKAAPWAAEGRMWHVPAEFSKNGDAHWVYLTDTAKRPAEGRRI